MLKYGTMNKICNRIGMLESLILNGTEIATHAVNGAGAYLATVLSFGMALGAGGYYLCDKYLMKKPEPVKVPRYRLPFIMFKKEHVPSPTTYLYDFLVK